MNSDSEKQEVDTLLEIFVEKHVIANQSLLMCNLVEKAFFEVEEIQNLYDEKRLLEDFADQREEGQTDEDLLELAKDALGRDVRDFLEQATWWLVDEWLSDKLLERKEVILTNDYGHWWITYDGGFDASPLNSSVLNDIYSEYCR